MTDQLLQGRDSRCLCFLAMFLARTHRTLYRAQCIGGLAEELGFGEDEAQLFARELRERGLLRELSALQPRGPMMEITPRGIEAVRSAYGRADA